MIYPIISVHVPKCGGTSFKNWLESVVDSSTILYDYGDRPIDPTSPMNVDTDKFLQEVRQISRLPEDIKAVHGHFWIKKYDQAKKATRITFLRHPIDRTLSHYYFWRTKAPEGHALHDRFLAEGMDILTFAAMPEISGFYRNYLFRDYDMSNFDFIGSFDEYEEDLTRLEELVGVRGTRAHMNRNPSAEYPEERMRIMADWQLRERLASTLVNDIAFFERQMVRRRKLIDSLGSSL